METILQDRKIRLWELVCQHYSIPRARMEKLDKLIRAGEEIPPAKWAVAK